MINTKKHEVVGQEYLIFAARIASSIFAFTGKTVQVL